MNKYNLSETNIDEFLQRIESVEKMRRDFVANVSHELRTPLTVINGYIEELMIREENAPYYEIFKQIYSQSKRMDNLISNLLLLSKLENTELHNAHVVNASKMIEKIIEEVQSVYSDVNHQYKVHLDPSLSILGDENELKSIFSNLVINACKYTPTKGLIQIAWFEYKNNAIFEVQDSGIGIPKKHISRLTERFYRVDKARSRNSGGTGLGLAIVKHALMRHKGQLEIKSQVHKGSCFRATFPSIPLNIENE